MGRLSILMSVTAVALGVAIAAQQQEMLPKPGPGSGVNNVRQVGDWHVAISNTPSVRVTGGVPLRGPAFLKSGTYKITWPNGDQETVTITVISDARRSPGEQEPAEGVVDAWVEVKGSPKRWLNLSAARAIEEAR